MVTGSGAAWWVDNCRPRTGLILTIVERQQLLRIEVGQHATRAWNSVRASPIIEIVAVFAGVDDAEVQSASDHSRTGYLAHMRIELATS